MLYNNICETIGRTPLVRINKLSNGKNIFAKIESFNPFGSIKDRIVLAMIEDAENSGQITKDTIFIEPTSGNTGIALSAICSSKGYHAIVVMPENVSTERKLLIEAYGANIILTPSSEGIIGSVRVVNELLQRHVNYFCLDQFRNINNKIIHQNTTAQEIIEDTAGNVDILVSGIGTGGTITGLATTLKNHNINIKIIAVVPNSPEDNIPGLGAGFELELLDNSLIDETIGISEKDAINMVRKLATHEGILVGISSGAAMYAALIAANRTENTSKNIVVIFPDRGEHYISTGIFGES